MKNIILFCFICISNVILAQEFVIHDIIKTTTGEEYQGTILKTDQEYILLKSISGIEINIPQNIVETINTLEETTQLSPFYADVSIHALPNQNFLGGGFSAEAGYAFSPLLQLGLFVSYDNYNLGNQEAYLPVGVSIRGHSGEYKSILPFYSVHLGYPFPLNKNGAISSYENMIKAKAQIGMQFGKYKTSKPYIAGGIQIQHTDLIFETTERVERFDLLYKRFVITFGIHLN